MWPSRPGPEPWLHETHCRPHTNPHTLRYPLVRSDPPVTYDVPGSLGGLARINTLFGDSYQTITIFSKSKPWLGGPRCALHHPVLGRYRTVRVDVPWCALLEQSFF